MMDFNNRRYIQEVNFSLFESAVEKLGCKTKVIRLCKERLSIKVFGHRNGVDKIRFEETKDVFGIYYRLIVEY